MAMRSWGVPRGVPAAVALVVSAVVGGFVAALAFVPLTANAAAGCVGRYEFEQMHGGMSVAQVANWFDTYGNYIGDQGNNQRRAYTTCWNPNERRVIVEFSYDTGDAVDWYVRDV